MAGDPTRTYPSPLYYVRDGSIPDFTFEHVDVKQELLDALKIVLPKQGYSDVKVLRSDPQTAVEIPCIGINRVNDDESSAVMTDTIAEPTYDAATGAYTVLKGTYFQESLELRIWHTNADVRDLLYPIVKATCLALREHLTYLGLREISFRGGRDEQDTEMQHAPTPLFWASITISYLNPLNVFITTIEPPIAKGDGVPNGVMVTP